MTTTTHPAHGPVSLVRLHQIHEILSKAAAQSNGGNLGYAMADAVKVIDGAIAAFGAEPVAWIAKKKTTGEMELDEPHAKATNPKYWTDAFPVYTAPPAPVVQKVMSRLAYLLDEDQFHNIESMVLAAGIHPAGTSQVIPEVMSTEDLQYKPLTKSWREGWNACRAAMLQGAEPVTTASKLPFEQWLSQQTGTIDVECGCVMTEVFFHWLRVAYEAGNSPVTPDCWIPVSERMPEAHEPIYIFHPDYGVDEGVWYDNQEDAFLWDSDCSRCRAIETVSHWMPMPAMPAAPRQEVSYR